MEWDLEMTEWELQKNKLKKKTLYISNKLIIN